MTFTLRACRPDEADARFLFELRNDPLSRRMSFDQSDITWEQHLGWYRDLLADPARLGFIAEAEGRPAAVVRYARDREGREANVGITLHASWRGCGLAGRVLAEGERALGERWPDLCSVRAEIRPENEASVRAFTRAGFLPDEGVRRPGMLVLRRTLPLSRSRPFS